MGIPESLLQILSIEGPLFIYPTCFAVERILPHLGDLDRVTCNCEFDIFSEASDVVQEGLVH